MFKSLRAPEKLYALSMWALSLVFAGFLIGLGGRIVDDLPRLDRVPQQADFADRAGLQRIDAALDALAAEQRERADRRSRLQLAQDSAAKDRSTAEAAHRSWLATRSARDRLLIGDSVVRVVDFKTTRLVPGSPDEIPEFHLRQMAAYAAALRAIFPGPAVEAGLLYTAGPVLFTLPPELLELHKPRFGPTEQS